MKMMHISDLHLGKTVHGFSMLEEQADMLDQIVERVEKNEIEVLLVSGDIYDRSVPPESAVLLLNSFLNRLSGLHVEVFMVGGNHDSAIRLQFGSEFFEQAGIHIVSVYDGTIASCRYKNADIYMIPFLKPSIVRPYFPEEEIRTYEEAMRCVLSTIRLDPQTVHIALVHQFIAGSKTCESETKSVGGIDQISAGLFDMFDYVALGHLHSYQSVREHMVYSGTLLKYSVDEISQHKYWVLLDVNDTVCWHTEAFVPLHDLVELKGSYEQLTRRSTYASLDPADYYSIVLTDEYDVVNAQAKLQTIYPKILKLTYANRKTEAKEAGTSVKRIEQTDPLDLINAFYKSQNGKDLSAVQKQYLIDEWEEIQ